jgi:DNA-binding SARP family transcriptional activator/tetratricopeptide (TPR) repeat protein
VDIHRAAHRWLRSRGIDTLWAIRWGAVNLEFSILGPIEVRRDGDPVAISSRRVRTLLATLLLGAGEVVPLERTVLAIWGERRPLTARSQLHHCVSVLRQLLGGPEQVVTHPTGYSISIGAGGLDALLFDQYLTQARAGPADAATAAGLLRSALALWRGPALFGSDSAVVRQGARLLDERRLQATEELADCELALGRHREIVADLQERLREAPTRERLAGQLMLALYRSGRQVEALEVYRRLRADLVDDQGLDPGAELQRLHGRILAGEETQAPATGAELRPSPPGPPGPAEAETRPRPGGGLFQLPPAPADFTGRGAAVSSLEALLTGSGGGLPIAVISGVPGAGKSTLALQVAHRVRDKFPDGQIHLDMYGMRPDAVEPHVALGRCLRALGVASTAQSDDVEERAAQYRDQLADRRMLVVIDDVRSAADVRTLLPGSPECAVLITSRHRLPELDGAHHVQIATFTPDEAVALLGRLVGAPRITAEPACAAELVTQCGLLPLAVRVAGARLAVRPGWRLSRLSARLRDEAGRLDELAAGDLGVRASLALTYRALPEPARRLFRLISLLSASTVPAYAAAAALDVGIRPAETLLEQLVDVSLFDTVDEPDGESRYRMHDLIRLYGRERAAQEDSAEARQAALGRMIGAWVARAEDADDELGTRTLAVIRSDAPRWRPAPGGGPAAAGDPTSWFHAERLTLPMIIRQAADLGLTAAAWHLAAAVQSYLELRGEHDEALVCHQVALDACRRDGDRLGEGVMLRNRADLWTSRTGGDREDKLLAAGAALEIFRELGETAGAVDALNLCADVLRAVGRHTQARAYLAEALEWASRSGYSLGECHAVANLAIINREQGRYAEGLPLAERYLALADGGHGHREQSVALTLVAVLALAVGDADRGERSLHEALRISRQAGDLSQEIYTLVRLGHLQVQAGHPDARGSLEEGLARARERGLAFGEALAWAALGELALREGNSHTAVDALTRAAQATGDLRYTYVRAQVLTNLGRAHTINGDHRDARAAWSAALDLFELIHNRGAVAEVTALLSSR